MILPEGRAREESSEVEDVVPGPRFGGEGEFELEGRDDGSEEFLRDLASQLGEFKRVKAQVDGERTLESMSVFSGQATRTKHSTSMKLASFAGLSLPTATV